MLWRCKNVSGDVPSNRSTFSEQPSQPRTDIYSDLAPSLLHDSEGEPLLPQQIHGYWFILPAVPVGPTPSYTRHPDSARVPVGPTPSYTRHPDSARLNGEDEEIALCPILKGQAETSPAVHPRYCYLVSMSPLTVSLDPNRSLRPCSVGDHGSFNS